MGRGEGENPRIYGRRKGRKIPFWKRSQSGKVRVRHTGMGGKLFSFSVFPAAASVIPLVGPKQSEEGGAAAEGERRLLQLQRLLRLLLLLLLLLLVSRGRSLHPSEKSSLFHS